MAVAMSVLHDGPPEDSLPASTRHEAPCPPLTLAAPAPPASAGGQGGTSHSLLFAVERRLPKDAVAVAAGLPHGALIKRPANGIDSRGQSCPSSSQARSLWRITPMPALISTTRASGDRQRSSRNPPRKLRMTVQIEAAADQGDLGERPAAVMGERGDLAAGMGAVIVRSPRRRRARPARAHAAGDHAPGEVRGQPGVIVLDRRVHPAKAVAGGEERRPRLAPFRIGGAPGLPERSIVALARRHVARVVPFGRRAR